MKPTNDLQSFLFLQPYPTCCNARQKAHIAKKSSNSGNSYLEKQKPEYLNLANAAIE